MKKILFALCLTIASVPLTAKPYLYQYRGHGRILIFRGDIDDKNQSRVYALQTKYLESLKYEKSSIYPYYRLRGNANYRTQLRRLGIQIEDISDNPYIRSENAYTP